MISIFKRSDDKKASATGRDPPKTPNVNIQKDKGKFKTGKVEREYKVPYIHPLSQKKMSHFEGVFQEQPRFS